MKPRKVVKKQALKKARELSPAEAAKLLRPSRSAFYRSAETGQFVSTLTAFKSGFVGSFKLAADAVKAVSSVGGRFIKDDDDDRAPRARA